MQLFLNGKELDLHTDERVAITMQINDLADLSKANTSYTNKFKIPKTAKNVEVMNYLGVPGNQSRVQYTLNNCTLIEDSLILVANGFAVIDDCDSKNYNINIYGPEKTFFEKLKSYTLRDVYGVRNIIWSAEILKNYINQLSNFCFPIAQYNATAKHSASLQSQGIVFTQTKVLQTSPHFFVRHLFERIFTHLGYTVSYPMSSDIVFSRLVIPSTNGVSSYAITYGDAFNIQNCLPQESCDVLIREIMYRYGLVIKVDEFNKKVTFTKLDTLIKSSPVIDWTDKFVEMKKEQYNIDYGQINYFKYKDDVVNEHYPSQFPADELLGIFEVENETLQKEKIVIESTFIKPVICRTIEANDSATGSIWFWNQGGIRYYLLDVAETEIDGEDVKPREVPFQIQYLKNITGTLGFRFERPDGTTYQEVTQTPRYCTKDNLSFQGLLDDNYPQVVNMLQQPVTIKCIMNLNLLDIHQFDFHKRIYLEQYQSFFYCNKISNWQKNKLVEVELIKIPPIISTGGGYYSSSASMIGSL